MLPQRRPRAGGYPYKSLFQLDKWIPAFERVKKTANRLNPGRSVVPAKVLFQRLKWIPAFAGMTLRSLAEVCNFDSFTRSFAEMTLRSVPESCNVDFFTCSCAGMTLGVSIRCLSRRTVHGITTPQTGGMRSVFLCRLSSCSAYIEPAIASTRRLQLQPGHRLEWSENQPWRPKNSLPLRLMDSPRRLRSWMQGGLSSM